MGELITSIRFGGTSHKIDPLARELLHGGRALNLRQVCERSGGLILGEGDTGKSTYAVMLQAAAEIKGPSKIIRLRRRQFDFVAPQIKEDEVATIILDGLDEFPECVRDIVDFAEDLDKDRYHIWVTSRACDAASRLCESTRFEEIYKLDAFTEQDIIKLANSLDLEGKIFLARVKELNLEDIIRKPGGVVLLLDLFANGELDEVESFADILDTIVRRFVASTRDGHVESILHDSSDPNELIEVAAKIAAALTLTGSNALWIGRNEDCPTYDIPIEDFIDLGIDKKTVAEVLSRRIFEPLSTERYRINYTAVSPYLTARCLLASYDDETIVEKLPPDELFRREDVYSSYLSITEPDETAVWLADLNSDLGLKYIHRSAAMFARCHDTIRKLGFDKYHSLYVSQYEAMRAVRRSTGYFPELAEYLFSVLKDPHLTKETLIPTTKLLCNCATDIERVFSAVIDTLHLLKFDFASLHLVLKDLIDLCPNGITPKAAERLRPLYRSSDRMRNEATFLETFRLLNRFFDYPQWLIDKKELYPVEEEPEIHESVRFYPSEKFVVESIERNPTAKNIARLKKYEIARGIKYKAIDKFFEDKFGVIDLSSLNDVSLLTLAIERNPQQYLSQVIDLIEEPTEDGEDENLEIIHFFTIAAKKHDETLSLCFLKISSEQATKLLKIIEPYVSGYTLGHLRAQAESELDDDDHDDIENGEEEEAPSFGYNLPFEKITDLIAVREESLGEKIANKVMERMKPVLDLLHKCYEILQWIRNLLTPLIGFIGWARSRNLDKAFDNRYAGTEDITPPIRQQAVRALIDKSYKVKINYSNSTAKKYSEGLTLFKACEEVLDEHPEYKENGGYKTAKDFYKSADGYSNRAKNPIKFGTPPKR